MALIEDFDIREVRVARRRLQFLQETSRGLTGMVDGTAVTVWAPARPMEGPWKWRRRFRRAWLCLTGRAEAVQWF